MSTIQIISYGANIVFVTYGFVQFLNSRKRNREVANFLNASYEMANRLTNQLGKSEFSGQAEDIASALKSTAMNFMNEKRDEINSKILKNNNK